MAANGAARAIREAAGLSLGEAGKAAGLHKATIHRYERGLRRPRGAAAAKYLALLDELSR